MKTLITDKMLVILRMVDGYTTLGLKKETKERFDRLKGKMNVDTDRALHLLMETYEFYEYSDD